MTPSHTLSPDRASTAVPDRRDAPELVTLRDGSTVVVRPIAPPDAARLRRMFERLSPETVYRRFFSPVVRPSPRALIHLATVDHDRREALVALSGDEIVGVARYDRQPGGDAAEIAVTIEDAWQHRGLGSRLARRLAARAARRGIAELSAAMLGDNRPALGLLRRLAPDSQVRFEHGEYAASVPITPHAHAPATPA